MIPCGVGGDVIAGTSASVAIWGEVVIGSDVSTRQVTPATRGADVGMLTFAHGTAATRVPLDLDSTIREPEAWRLTHPHELLEL